MIKSQIKYISGNNLKIVFPEGEDVRILSAAARLKSDDILIPIILGDVKTINKLAKVNNIDLTGIGVINPETINNFDFYVKKFIECREGKHTLAQAQTLLKDVNYFGAIMTHLGEADGMVSGAVYASSKVIRPALQIIKVRDDAHLVSGAMLMIGSGSEKYILADIAVNPTLDARQLAEVAIESARTATMFGINPRVAMLSYFTSGSVDSHENDKVVVATRIAKELAPDLSIDGAMQFDAAVIASIGVRKMPDSNVAGRANVFIFPDLHSGNIAYKITQYLGGFSAYGPLLQGLNKPVNDLSRGCTEDDVYNVAIITAAQALQQRSN